jgi:hypothetical protein
MRSSRDVRIFRRGGAPPAAAPAWAPSDLSDLVLWLDNTLITQVAGLVTAWPDLSSEGNDGVQANPALQGDYEFLGWDGTQPCVLLNGETSGEHLTFDAGTLPASLSGNDTPYTITLVCQITTNPTSDRMLLSAGNSGTFTPFLDLRVSSTDRYSFLQRDDAAVISTASEAVSSFDTGRHQFTLHFDGTTRTLYKDGVSIATNATALGTITLNRFTLGRLRRTVSEEGVDFRTPGMTIYSRALTAPELALLWQYNRDHFGGLP